MNTTILLTGAAGGFGQLITDGLLAAGHRVAATMRAVDARNRAVAARLRGAGALVVEMDVTDTASVDAGVAQAIAAFGQIDVVVNNAGVGVLGLQEAYTPEDLQRLFDINVFGVQRVNRAVLPAMRQRGAGLLIHVSSLLGRIPIPFYGPYNASKWALEALAENYRTEVSQSGVEVCLVEPGGYPTSFIDHLMRPSDHARAATYGGMQHAPEAALSSFEQALAANPKQDPKLVADAIATLIAMPAGARPFRTTVDTMGMGAAVDGYNEKLAQITEGIYGAFGMGALLKVKRA